MSPQKKQNQSRLFGVFLLPALLIGALVVIAIGVMSFSDAEQTSQGPGDGPIAVSNAVMNKLRNHYDALAESIGPANAPVTIREFGDYQCPACGAFEPTAERIRQAYLPTGKVRFLFYDFPLAIHAHSQAAAIAARCAARQNQFWPYHDRLYGAQSQWADEKNPTSTYLDIALESGLDMNQFKACIKSQATLPVIKKERAAGKLIKLRATPTVMVNNTLFVGGPSYETLKSTVDVAIANADQKDLHD